MSHARTDLTDEVATRLIDVAGKTMNWAAVARAIGKDRSTIWRWRKLAERGEEPYAHVFALAYEAISEHQMRLLQEMEEYEGPVSWQAKAWLLERSMPDVWGMVPALRPDVVEEGVTTSKESRLDALEQALDVALPDAAPDDELAQLRARIAELEAQRAEAADG